MKRDTPAVMTAALEKRLGALLDQYDETRRAARTREDEVRAEERRFLDGFAAVRASVLRPLFEAAGAMLAQRGLASSIREQEFAPPQGGAPAEAGIALYVAPEGVQNPPGSAEELRTLSFTTRHYNKTVSVRNGAAPYEGTLAGAKGAYPLERIDLELAEAELLKLVSAIAKA